MAYFMVVSGRLPDAELLSAAYQSGRAGQPQSRDVPLRLVVPTAAPEEAEGDSPEQESEAASAA